MSLLVDLQLTPQRILERVRAAVLQNREALRHGGVRSRVKQATNQRPQFTKVGATMRDYKAPVPIASSRREKEQNLAWAYLVERADSSWKPGIVSVYSANGEGRYDNYENHVYVERSPKKETLEPIDTTTITASGTYQPGSTPWHYVEPGSGEFIPQEVMQSYADAQSAPPALFAPQYGWIPTASCYNYFALFYNYDVFPLGNDELVIEYGVQLVQWHLSVAQVVLVLKWLGQDEFHIDYTNEFNLGNFNATRRRRLYHQVTAYGEYRRWAFLVGNDFVKPIRPSEATTIFPSYDLEYNENDLVGYAVPGISPTNGYNGPRYSYSRPYPSNYTGYGLFGSGSGWEWPQQYSGWTDPGVFSYASNKAEIDNEIQEAAQSDPESETFQLVNSYEYADKYVPSFAKRLRLLTLAHPQHSGTAAKFTEDHRSYAITDDLLSEERLDLWIPMQRIKKPPLSTDDDFPSRILSDLESWTDGIHSDPALKTYVASDWGRPAYCRQQLIDVLGFTEEDLTPPTP